MINKIYKTIHSKYFNFFKFFFFLRYLFSIFLIAISLFLSIPKLFDYEKKQEVIKRYLIDNYDLETNNFISIKYNIFPLPNLSVKDISFKLKNEPIRLKTNNLNIFLNLNSIYNYENFSARKILFDKNKITLDIDKTIDLFNHFKKIKFKFSMQYLNLDLIKQGDSVIEIKKINYDNYGYKKNKVTGEIFEKKFKAHLRDDNKSLDFKILNTGIDANFSFNKAEKKYLTSGISKINISNNYLKLNFIVHNDKIEFVKSNLRNKNLLVSFDSLLTFSPYFEISSNIEINKMNKKLIDSLRLEQIIKNQEILKKLNSNNKITYNIKKSRNSLIQKHYTELNLAHGRLIFLSKIYILGGIVDCKGDSLVTDDYPRLNFDCTLEIKNKKKILKFFSNSKKFDNLPLNLNIIGSLNLINKKVDFEKIEIKDQYIAKEEDIIFFKDTFEKFLFDEGFFNMFKENKIKEFFLEVI